MEHTGRPGWLQQLRERGVLRVAASYAVIGWLLLQIADVTFDPLGLPKWAMTSLIVAVALGFPVAVLLAWFYELGDQGITRDHAPAAAPRPHVHGARRYADVAIIGVLLLVVAVLLVRQSDLGKPPPPAKPALAVLPFANLSGDPAQQYFSDGLAEEVLDRLGQVPGLMVVGRSSSFSFRDRDADVRNVAEKLGVNAVLEGAVRRDGKRLRLSAKLIDGKSGYQLWSGSFDREVNDVFAVQAELAQAVIDAIVPVARGDEPPAALQAQAPTTSLNAYDLYLLGRAKANVRWPASLLKSVEYFEGALRLDPKFAKAQAGLATSLVLLIEMDEITDTPRQQRVDRAEAAVYQALALDPRLPEARVAQANLLMTLQRPGAGDIYREVVESNPNYAEAWHYYGRYLTESGQRDAAERATRKAHALDPLAISPWMNYLSLILRPGAKEYRAELQKASEVFAGNPDALRRFAIVSGPIGFPLDAWRFVTAARRDAAASDIVGTMTRIGPLGLWSSVDPHYVVEHGEPLLRDPAVEGEWRAWLLDHLIPAHGRLGDEARVRELFAEYARVKGEDDPGLNAMRAFWFSVLGRYPEADAALRRPHVSAAETGGISSFGRDEAEQSLPALIRLYRATGRAAEADRIGQAAWQRYRSEQPKNPDVRRYDHWIRDAALAASLGRKDDAVYALNQALRWSDIPVRYAPDLPWFRSLEGYAPYDALEQEFEQRVRKAREGMLALDATLPAELRQ